jgi:hypothetical protein
MACASSTLMSPTLGLGLRIPRSAAYVVLFSTLRDMRVATRSRSLQRFALSQFQSRARSYCGGQAILW